MGNNTGDDVPMKKKICRYCGEEMIEHIIKEGARYHITSYYKGKNGALSHCSESKCENNHGPGHCVPYSKTDLERMEALKKGIFPSKIFFGEE